MSPVSIIYRATISILLFLSAFSVQSQSLCFTDAEDLAEEGLFSQVKEKLDVCLRSKGNFESKEEEIRAWELLTRANLYLDLKDSAFASMEELLKLDPTYLPDKQDPAEVTYLFDQFVIEPSFDFRLYAGSLFPFIRETEMFSAGNESRSQNDYSGKFGYGAGIGVDYRLVKGLGVGTGVRFGQKIFDYQGDVSTTTIEGQDFNRVAFRETQFYADVPLYLKYTFRINKSEAKRGNIHKKYEVPKKWEPYVFGGVEFNFLIAAEINDANREIVEDFETSGSDLPSIDLLGEIPQRERFNLSILAGAGIRHRVSRRSWVLLEVSYSYGLTNVVNRENRFSSASNPTAPSNQLAQPLLYIDSDLKMDNLAMAVGYMVSLYDITPKR